MSIRLTNFDKLEKENVDCWINEINKIDLKENVKFFKNKI